MTTADSASAASSSPAPISSLPARPSLALLSNLADSLRKSHQQRQPTAIARLKNWHPRFASMPDEKIAQTLITLRDAQLVIAREHGFEHWAALKKHVISLHDDAGKEHVEALIAAVKTRELAQVAKLLDAHPAVINARGGSGTRTALHFAAQVDDVAIVELLLNSGADPTIRDVGDNATPLHFAAEQGSLPVVKLLIERGADPNGFGDVHGWDVIGWATLHDHVHADVARYLLESGAQHNIFTAVAMGDVDAVRKLADFNTLDKPMAAWESRRRPLHLAVVKRQPQALATLLEMGADIESTEINGWTALDEAAMSGQIEMAQVLIARGARVHLPAAFALRRDDLIEHAMREDPDRLAPAHRDERLIVLASRCAPGDVIESLIAHGASVHTRIDSRWSEIKNYTALHEAAWFENLDAIRVLLKHGAPADAEDATYKGTPYGWARHAGRTRSMKLLEELGAAKS